MLTMSNKEKMFALSPNPSALLQGFRCMFATRTIMDIYQCPLDKTRHWKKKRRVLPTH